MSRNRLILQILILLFINSAASIATSVNDNVADNNAGDDDGPANIIQGDRLTPFHPIGHQISVHADDQFCGGTILDDWHILTAAHCVIKISGKPAKAIYAGPNKTIYHRADTANMTRVDKVYVPRLPFHSCAEYKPDEDIAVLKLTERLGLATNPNINSVNLPEPLHDDVYNTYEQRTAMIAGFGVSEVETYIATHGQEALSNVIYPDTVQVARVWILSQVECQKIWSPTKIEPNTMCGRIQGPGYRGVCKSDNGNGLIYLNAVIGVLSFSSGLCYEGQAVEGRPAVYTRVTAYVPFLRNVLQNNVTEASDVCGFSQDEVSASGVCSLISMWSLVFMSIAVITVMTV